MFGATISESHLDIPAKQLHISTACYIAPVYNYIYPIRGRVNIDTRKCWLNQTKFGDEEDLVNDVNIECTREERERQRERERDEEESLNSAGLEREGGIEVRVKT